MKLGIMTDLHLGVKQYGLEEREDDFYEQYMRAINTFVDMHVDVVIIGGDIFDQPRPSPKALKTFTNGLTVLNENGIEVLNVVGNHAMIQSPNFVTADEFVFRTPGLSNCSLLESHENGFWFSEEDDVAIFGLPFFFNFEIDRFIETVNKLNSEAEKNSYKSNILVLHQSFKEFCGFMGETLSINDINTDAFDLIICGHIHERKLFELDNGTIFLQPGSLERSSVAEARDEENQGKGIFIFDTDDINIDTVANGFIRLKSERKFLIADMLLDSKDDIRDMEKEIMEEVDGCSVEPILFLTVHDKSGSFHEILDLTKDLKKDCLTVRFNYFDESVTEEDMVLSSDDIPTPREALRIALNPLDEDEANLAIDLYDLLKDGKDASELLSDFLEKRRAKCSEK